MKDSETSPVPTSHQLHGVKLSDVGQDQLVTIGCLDGITNEATTIDFSTYEHVQCCGHKVLMTSSSFHTFHSNLFVTRVLDR